MLDQETIQAARKNGSVGVNWYGDRRPSVDGVVDLLVEGSQFNRHIAIRLNSTKLVEMMAEDEWTLTAGSHKTSRDRPNADQTNHYTVSFGRNRSYHLRHDARGHLFQITGPGLPALAPWSSPGSDAMISNKQ